MSKRHIPAYAVRADRAGPIVFLASSPNVASDGLEIPVKSWELDRFQQTGSPLLWAHDYMSRPPIGRVENLRRTEEGLVGEARLDPGDPFAADCERKLRSTPPYLSAFSVGFDIHEMEGHVVKRCSLLEVSLVPVPADPAAVVLARQRWTRVAGTRSSADDFLRQLASAGSPEREPSSEADFLRTLAGAGTARGASTAAASQERSFLEVLHQEAVMPDERTDVLTANIRWAFFDRVKRWPTIQEERALFMAAFSQMVGRRSSRVSAL